MRTFSSLGVALALITLTLAASSRAQEQAPRPIVGPVAPVESPAATSSSLSTAPREPPPILPYDAPVPAGYQAIHRTRRGVVGGGIALFTATYALSITASGACALFTCAATASLKPLLIPALGPFVQMTQTQSAAGNVLLALDGLGQLGGIAMIGMGIAFPQEVIVVDASRSTVVQVAFTPLIGRAGVGVVGVF